MDDDDKRKRMLAPLQMELELDTVGVQEFPCPWCNGPIQVEVYDGLPEEDSKD